MSQNDQPQGASQTSDLPPESSPASPCIRNCCLNQFDICVGCGRSLEEIRSWTAYSPSQRDEVRQKARKRVDELKSHRF